MNYEVHLQIFMLWEETVTCKIILSRHLPLCA